MTINRLKVMGLIPARGNSKRIPNKNMLKINGKTLMQYAIETGLESRFIDKLIVSTDSLKIAEHSHDNGAEVPFIRPKKISGDNVLIHPVVLHAVNSMKKVNFKPDIVVIIYATTPLKTSIDIDNMISNFVEGDYDSMRSVCKTFTHPKWTFQLENNLIKNNKNLNDKNVCISQNLPDTYQFNGLIDVINVHSMINNKSLFGKKIGAYIFPQSISIDIDTMLDVKRIEQIIKDNNEPKTFIFPEEGNWLI